MTIFRFSDHSRNGFTLVEMMIALLVFSMLAVAGVLLLRSAVDSNEVTDARLREMSGMQRLVSLMEADLSQAIARTYRDEDGDRKAAFIAESRVTDEDFLSFTRGGQGNVNDEPRSSLQRVSYRLTQGQLERRQFEMTDGGFVGDPAPLVSGIENLEIRFRDRRGQWLRDWRPGRLNDMPRALELQFDQNGRTYRHVFLVGTGYL